jgi:hypothetical protein
MEVSIPNGTGSLDLFSKLNLQHSKKVPQQNSRGTQIQFSENFKFFG